MLSIGKKSQFLNSITLKQNAGKTSFMVWLFYALLSITLPKISPIRAKKFRRHAVKLKIV